MEQVHLNLPAEIKLAVQTEAERQMTTAAAYVRRAIAQALHADGISTKRGLARADRGRRKSTPPNKTPPRQLGTALCISRGNISSLATKDVARERRRSRRQPGRAAHEFSPNFSVHRHRPRSA